MRHPIVFEKMHGIGNDFVLIDNREQNINISPELVTTLANRHTGIGFDQLLLVEHSVINSCDAAYRFFNPDGSQAEQCGNGQRCISKYLHKQDPEKTIFCISGLAGLIHSEVLSNGDVCVNMGQINAIKPVLVNNQACHHVDFGNPHLVTIIDNVTDCDLPELNKNFTHDYPSGINFEVVQILSNNQIKVRVHERGTGETMACGSGACASVGALQSAGKLDNRVKVMLPGGNLMIEYHHSIHSFYLIGSATHVFTGEIII